MNKGARHARILLPPRPYRISVRGTRACAYLRIHTDFVERVIKHEQDE